MTQYVPERVTSILRTDPERAKRMDWGGRCEQKRYEES